MVRNRRRTPAYGPDDVAMVQGGDGYQAPPSIREQTMTLLQIRKDSLLDQERAAAPGNPSLPRLEHELEEIRRLIGEVRDDALGPRIYDLLDDLKREKYRKP